MAERRRKLANLLTGRNIPELDGMAQETPVCDDLGSETSTVASEDQVTERAIL